MAMFQIVKNSFLQEVNFIKFKYIKMVSSNRGIHSSKRRKLQEATVTDTHEVNKLEDGHDKQEKLDFDNYKLAYKSMTTKELLRALLVLRLSSINFFVDNSLKTMHYSRKILGETIFNKIAKTTFYGQFVGGDNESSLMSCVDRNRQAGIGLMLAIPMEDDAEQSTDIETKCDKNLQIVLKSMDLLDKLSDAKPMFQVKLTALIPGLLCAAISKCVPEPSTEPAVVEHIADALQGNKTVIIKGLSKEETDQLQNGVARLRTLLKAAEDKRMVLLVDAEYTYLNPALNLFSLAMMLKCYTDKPLIYYTYQNYLKSTDHLLSRDISFIKSHGVGFAAKLVRGAYLEKERHLAKKNGYEDPVHPTFEDTTNTYTNSLNKMLNNISREPSKFAVVVATHNEGTVLYAVKRMTELGLQPSHGSVFFGQVYGMCDHISYTLGQNGYLIYKSIPYGTVADTLPYLSRRALENRSVMDFRRERKLLVDAFWDRMSISTTGKT